MHKSGQIGTFLLMNYTCDCLTSSSGISKFSTYSALSPTYAVSTLPTFAVPPADCSSCVRVSLKLALIIPNLFCRRSFPARFHFLWIHAFLTVIKDNIPSRENSVGTLIKWSEYGHWPNCSFRQVRRYCNDNVPWLHFSAAFVFIQMMREEFN